MTPLSGFFLGYLFLWSVLSGVVACGGNGNAPASKHEIKSAHPPTLWGGSDDRFVFIFICRARYQTMMIYLRERTRSTAMLGKYEIAVCLMTDDSKNSFAAQISLHCCAKSVRYTRQRRGFARAQCHTKFCDINETLSIYWQYPRFANKNIRNIFICYARIAFAL